MQSKPRVAFAWNGLPAYGARYLSHLINFRDQRVDVIASDGPQPRSQIEAILGRRITWVEAREPLSWGRLPLIPPDLLVHTGWAYRGFNDLARDVKRRGGRVVAMVDNNRKHNVRQAIGRMVFNLVHRRRFDAVWVPGESGKELMRYFGFPARRTYTGFYGADPAIFRPGPPLADRPERFLFVGQFVRRKAPELLAAAFALIRNSFPSWSLTMIGEGELARSIQGASVEVLPFSSPESIAHHMRQSRFLVLPSFEEHWGVVVHEAALSGCGLVLSSAVGAAADLMTAENGFIFPPGDMGQLASALSQASSTSEAAYQRMFEESTTRAAHWGPTRFVNTFNTLLKDLF